MKKWILIAVTMLSLSSCEAQNQRDNSGNPEGKSTWDNSFGGVDKSYDSELLKLREEIAPRFQVLEFKDTVTGKTMSYNLFIPEDYDPAKEYPLVQFIADASTVGKGVTAPLMQGYGGIIWATEESQSENPSFVLVPAFSGPDWAVNDKHQVSDEVGIAFRLLNEILEQYSVDKNRIYTTGQSMGGMISFYYNATYPDIFAASLYVGSQWDISVLKPLIEDNFFYIVSAGDQKASAGMNALKSMLNENEVKFGDLEFSAQLPLSEQNSLVEKLISQRLPINMLQFTPQTVTPKGVTGGGSEHMYSFDYAYRLKPVRDWLFEQHKK